MVLGFYVVDLAIWGANNVLAYHPLIRIWEKLSLFLLFFITFLEIVGLDSIHKLSYDANSIFSLRALSIKHTYINCFISSEVWKTRIILRANNSWYDLDGAFVICIALCFFRDWPSLSPVLHKSNSFSIRCQNEEVEMSMKRLLKWSFLWNVHKAQESIVAQINSLLRNILDKIWDCQHILFGQNRIMHYYRPNDLPFFGLSILGNTIFLLFIIFVCNSQIWDKDHSLLHKVMMLIKQLTFKFDQCKLFFFLFIQSFRILHA